MKSLTRDCEPKPIATPTTPRLATRAEKLVDGNISLEMVMPMIMMASDFQMFFAMEERVRWRFSISLGCQERLLAERTKILMIRSMRNLPMK